MAAHDAMHESRGLPLPFLSNNKSFGDHHSMLAALFMQGKIMIAGGGRGKGKGRNVSSVREKKYI